MKVNTKLCRKIYFWNRGSSFSQRRYKPHCTVKIPELNFEIPPQTQKGSLTTVEGLIQKAAEGLRQTAKLNEDTNPEWAQQVLQFCTEKLEPIVNRKFQVTF